jgi:hypothetical protein
MPPGFPAWPAKPFLARKTLFTKGWQNWMLRLGESSRPDGDGQIAEGDEMSVKVLWLDFAVRLTSWRR